MTLRRLSLLACSTCLLPIAFAAACANAPPAFGDCASDVECTRISVCLCGRSTCDQICDLGAASRECYRYTSGGSRLAVAVTASDCRSCRALEAGFDPDVDCRTEVACPSGCSMPSCCATAADCPDGMGCAEGCCRTFTGPPPDAGAADSGRPAGCPTSCPATDCCTSTAQCTGDDMCIIASGADVGCCFTPVGPPPADGG